MDRPYLIYRTNASGRFLYDTQETREAAEASLRTGEVEYPNTDFHIVYEPEPRTAAGSLD
jgi:hypothetical protein